MNGFVNVQIRVLSAQAMRQLMAMQAQLNTLGGGFGNANRAAGLFGRSLTGMRLDAFGSRIQNIGRQLQYNFTLPILAAAAASLKLALDNEAAFTRVTKVYGDAAHGADFYAKEVKSLEKAFVALSNAYGVNQKETIGIAAQWAAAGVSGVALAKSVELTMKTMILGEMNAADATQALISIQAQYGQSTAELTDTIATLNMIENQTGISLAGLIQGFSRAAGVARGAGVDVRHLGAMLAALTPAAGSAAQAGNALKTIFSRLLNPTKETTEVLGLMGISMTDLRWKSANMVEQLQIMAEKFQTLSDKQKGVVSSVVASRWQVNKFEILMRELLNPMGYYAKALDATADKQRVFAQMTRELNAVLSSNPRRLQIIWTMLQNAAADIIQPMIPLLLYLAQAVKTVMQSFSNLNPGLQKIIISFLLLLAVIGPIIRIGGAFILLFAQLSHLFLAILAPLGLVARALFGLTRIPIVAFFTVLSTVVRASLLRVFAIFSLFPVFMTAIMVRIRAVIAIGMAATSAIWGSALSNLAAFSLAAMNFISAIIFAGMAAISRGMAVAWTAIVGVWRLGFLGILAAMRAFGAIALVRWGAIWNGLVFLTAAAFINIRSIILAFIPRLRALMTALYAAATGPWGIALAVIIVIVVAFWKQLKMLWKTIIEGTIYAWYALPKGIRNAMMAVVNIVNAAARAVYRAFSWMNPWARHSPSLVENVTTGMAEIAKQFSAADRITEILARAGMNLESFGRAVEKLKKQADLREIADQRADLASIAADALPEFDALVSVLFPLRDLLKEIGAEVKAQQIVVDAWKVKLDAANAALDEQQKILDTLKDVAAGYQDQLQEAQADLNKFTNAPIEGMKAMSDAIFENEMQQKALRLEMMRMEDALGPLDQLQARINSINGDIEVMSGQQKELRDAGAGSDILGYYDEQIDLLKEQHDAIIDQIKPLEELSREIDNLGRKAEELNLQNSLQFDPLKRQIDDLVNAMHELPFDEILAGVVANKEKVDQLTDAYNEAIAAVKAQEEVVKSLEAQRDAIEASYNTELEKLNQLKSEYDQVEDKIREIEQALRDVSQIAKDMASGAGGMSPGAQNFLDAAGGDFPDVGGAGGLGREGGLDDQAKMIDDFTKEMAAKTKNMFGLFNFLDPIKKGWNTGWNWLKDNLGPAFSAFGQTFSQGWKNIMATNPFEGMGKWWEVVKRIAGSIVDAFQFIWRAIGPQIQQFVDNAWPALQDAFKDIQPEIAKFRDLIGPLGEAFSNLWTLLKPILGIVLALALLVVRVFLQILVNVIGPAIRGIGEVAAAIIKILRGIAEFVTGVFALDWKTAWNGIKDIFGGIWDLIFGIFRGAVSTIIGIVKGLVEGIVGWVLWLWDELVGHSIIPDLVNAMIAWFNFLLDAGKSIFNALAVGIKWIFDNVIKPIFTTWGTAINFLKSLIGTAFDWIKGAWDNMVSKISWAWGQIGNFIGAIRGLFNNLWDTWASVVNNILNYIGSLVNGFNGIRNRFSFSGIFDGLKSAFSSAMNWIIGKWNNLSFGVGGLSIGTPNIPFLARGGMIAKQATAVVGEGRAGYPEYVIPTDPQYRKRALQLFQQLGNSLGLQDIVGKAAMATAMGALVKTAGNPVQFMARGGILGGSARRLRGATLVLAPQSSTKIYHFHGDLSFPNITGGGDAEDFLRNLEALAGE